MVTAHVQSLSKRLGVKLMYRDGRKARPTDAGERVYAWASEVRSNTSELMRDLDGLADGARGTVAVSASRSVGRYLHSPILGEFRERRPLTEITNASFGPRGSDPQRSIRRFGLRGDRQRWYPDLPAMEYEVIGEEPIALVAATDFLPETESLAFSDPRDVGLVSSPAGHIRRELIDRQLHAKGVTPKNILIELGHPEAMKSAIRRMLAVRSAVERELVEGAPREIELEGGGLAVSLAMIMRKRKRLSPVQEQLAIAVRQGISGARKLD